MIMKDIYFCCLLIFSTSILAQTKLSQTQFNLGELSRLNDDVVDLVLVNKEVEDLHILRIDADMGVSTTYTSLSIPVNNSTILRFKLNPKTNGKIKNEVNLYFSNSSTPTKIEITANVKQIPKNDLQECPSFNRVEMTKNRDLAHEGSKPIAIKRFMVGIGVDVLDENLADEEYENHGTKDFPSIEEQRKAISQTEEPKVVLHQKSKVKEKKERLSPVERRNKPSLLDQLFGDADQQSTDNKNREEKVEEAETVEEKINESDNSNTLSDAYKPNNVVFLIDASHSMNKEGRFDLLKASMIELLTPLRSIDSLAIVTYSDGSNVLIPPTSGIEKEKIAEVINSISASGGTQAVKGLNTAIEVGLSSFIENGNNQIILATDGDFDIGSKNNRLRKKIEETAERGLIISVVGIRQEKGSAKTLNEIKKLGKGKMLKIKKEKDSPKIINMIKKQSLH